MNCGRNAGSLRIYLQQIFQKADFADTSRQFELVRIGNPDKLAIIKATGVKRIDLDVDISETTASDLLESEATDGIWHSIVTNFGGAFKAITARDDSVEQLRLAEQGTVRVSINVPNRDLDVAKHGLDGLAEEVVEDDEADSFVIHLRDGATIKPNEVSVRKQVRLDAAANSVSVFQAWDAMNTYMGELMGSGQLEA